MFRHERRLEEQTRGASQSRTRLFKRKLRVFALAPVAPQNALRRNIGLDGEQSLFSHRELLPSVHGKRRLRPSSKQATAYSEEGQTAPSRSVYIAA